MVVKETYLLNDGSKQIVITPFRDWADIARLGLFKLLGDIEDMCVLMTGQEKENWTDGERRIFDRIRKKLLNRAGAIGRLPETLEDEE